MTSFEKQSLAFSICASITTLNALVSAGFSVARLLGPDGGEVALYAASRSVALLLAVFALSWIRSGAGLAALACVMGLVQTFDAGIGLISHAVGKTVGPFVFAIFTFASVGFLIRETRKCRTHIDPAS